MNGWLTIKTRLLTGNFKQGIKEITNSLGILNAESLAMLKTFAKIAIVVGIIVGVINIIKGAFDNLVARNDELANKIENIKLACSNLINGILSVIGNLLEPIITALINMIYSFFTYLNGVTKKYLGIDLFKNSEKSVKKMSSGTKATAKNVKDIKKQLASFDEMNVLSKDSPLSGGSGGGGGTTTKKPKTDLQEPDISNLIKKLKEIKDKVVDTWDFILKTDHDEAKKLIEQQGGNWTTLKLGIFDFMHGVVNIISGFYDLWSGIFTFIKGLITGNEEDITKGVQNIVKGVKKIIEGLISYMRSIPEMILGIIKGIAKTLLDYVNSKIYKVLIDKIKGIKDNITNSFKGGFWKGLLNGYISWWNKLIGVINNKLTISIGKTLSAILKGLGINVSAGKYQLFSIPKIPTLASGGIVSKPGMGVNMGSYIAGERGAEAVIPLTDDTLQRLANMIPINIDLTNTIDGRVLNRRLEQVRANNLFAGNR